jgi:hypothetical protein
MRRLLHREEDRERRLPGWEDEEGSDERMNPAVLFRVFLEGVLVERMRAVIEPDEPDASR